VIGDKLSVPRRDREETDQRPHPQELGMAQELVTQRIVVNGYTTAEAIVLVAPMPGVVADDVEIVVEGTSVTLRAALRTDAPKDYFLHEWDYGAYERTIELPEPVGEPVTASLGNGQLAVSLARIDPADGPGATRRFVVQPVHAGAKRDD
jgi:HSP20 family molecular chaperone IbpA